MLTSILLQNSFEMTLQQKPFLAGILKREEVGPKAGRFKVVYANAEAQKSTTRFWAKDLTKDPSVWPHSYPSLRIEGMPVSRIISNVLEPHITPEEPVTLPMAAQANFIPGGCLLYICMSYSMFDGSGAAMMIGAWAENCRKLQQYADFQPVTKPVASPSYEGFTLPSLLQDNSAPHNKETKGILQGKLLWQLLGLCESPVWRSAPAPSSSPKPLISAIFTAPKQIIKGLKD